MCLFSIAKGTEARSALLTMQGHEFEKLKQLLSEQETSILAGFIAEQALGDRDLCDAAWDIARRSAPVDLTSSLLAHIGRICGDKRYYDCNHVSDLDRCLDTILDRIEHDLLPTAPESAIEVLGAFFETDTSVFERADDDGLLSITYDRAAKLFARASRAAETPPSAGRWFERLMKEDHYGARTALQDYTANILPDSGGEL